MSVTKDNGETAAPSELPPLRLHHLLAWTAVLAVSLAVFNWSWPTDSQSALMIGVAVTSYVMSSAAFTCLVFGFAWRWRGMPFPNEPGQWMVVESGVTTVFLAIIAVFYGLSRRDEYYVNASWIMNMIGWANIITALAFALLNGVIAIWLVDRWRWKSIFWLVAVMGLATATLHVFLSTLVKLIPRTNVQEVLLWINLSVDAIPTLIVLMLLTFACLRDLRMQLVRHWSHWLGIYVWGVGYLIKIVRYVAAYFLGEL